MFLFIEMRGATLYVNMGWIWILNSIRTKRERELRARGRGRGREEGRDGGKEGRRERGKQ